MLHSMHEREYYTVYWCVCVWGGGGMGEAKYYRFGKTTISTNTPAAAASATPEAPTIVY